MPFPADPEPLSTQASVKPPLPAPRRAAHPAHLCCECRGRPYASFTADAVRMRAAPPENVGLAPAPAVGVEPPAISSPRSFRRWSLASPLQRAKSRRGDGVRRRACLVLSWQHGSACYAAASKGKGRV